jgi:hypothetical protein
VITNSPHLQSPLREKKSMKNKLSAKQKDIVTYVSILGPIAILMGFMLFQMMHYQNLPGTYTSCKVVEITEKSSNRGRTHQPKVITEGCNGEDKGLAFLYGEKAAELVNLEGIIDVGRVYSFETRGSDFLGEKPRIKEVVEVK